MAIKAECVIKSLKSDYKVIGQIAGVILAILGIIYVITVYKDIFTAFNVYIILEIGSMIPISYFVAFEKYTPESKERMKGKDNTILLIGMNSLIMGMFTFFYLLSSYDILTKIWRFPDITFITVIFLIINALIVCPLAVAYARCKE